MPSIPVPSPAFRDQWLRRQTTGPQVEYARHPGHRFNRGGPATKLPQRGYHIRPVEILILQHHQQIVGPCFEILVQLVDVGPRLIVAFEQGHRIIFKHQPG
jgi:hypothetical protein